MIASLRTVGHTGTRVFAATALLVAALLPAAAGAGRIEPTYHGALQIRPARGVIDQGTGIANLSVKRWRFVPQDASNGIAFDQEPVLLTISENELKNEFRLEPGALRRTRKGRRFLYRDPSVRRGIRVLRIDARRDGSYLVAFALRGVNLSRLVSQDPVCLPFALIVGDDDGFIGLQFESNFTRRLRIKPTGCAVEDWPWVDG